MKQRLSGKHKAGVFRDLRERYGIEAPRVFHGELVLDGGRRRTSELLADVESLLIKRLRPWGNIQSRHHRIARPGMRVRCAGAWPFRRAEFRDIG